MDISKVNPPAETLERIKADLKVLMQWAANTWLAHKDDAIVAAECREFYLGLSNIAAGVYLARSKFLAYDIGRLYQERKGE